MLIVGILWDRHRFCHCYSWISCHLLKTISIWYAIVPLAMMYFGAAFRYINVEFFFKYKLAVHSWTDLCEKCCDVILKLIESSFAVASLISSRYLAFIFFPIHTRRTTTNRVSWRNHLFSFVYFSFQSFFVLQLCWLLFIRNGSISHQTSTNNNNHIDFFVLFSVCYQWKWRFKVQV